MSRSTRFVRKRSQLGDNSRQIVREGDMLLVADISSENFASSLVEPFH